MITDVGEERALVSWGRPQDDGGSPVTGFMIERQDLDTGSWVPCGEAGPGDTEAQVCGLTGGRRYKFRVKAVNTVDESEPLESEEEVTIPVVTSVSSSPTSIPSTPTTASVPTLKRSRDMAESDSVSSGGAGPSGYQKKKARTNSSAEKPSPPIVTVNDRTMECEVGDCEWTQKTGERLWRKNCLDHFLRNHGDDLTQLGFRDSEERSLQIQDLYSYVGRCSQETCRHKIIARDYQSRMASDITSHYKNHHPRLTSHAYTPLIENGEVNVTSIISADHIKSCKPCKVILYNI